jgi:hypothetical protein
MAQTPQHKLFLGPRLRRLRRDLGFTQTRMAEDLGVSPSYLNHLERNQRPVTAQVLLRLASTYDVDIRNLSAEHASGARDLSEVLADPLFRDLSLARHEVNDAAENTPSVADAVVRLYRAYDELRRAAAPATGRQVEAQGEGQVSTPSDWVRDYIQAQHNFFPELDDAGETLAMELRSDLAAAEFGADPQSLALAGRRRLTARHRIQVQVVPAEAAPGLAWRYAHHGRRLFLSERLGETGRTFSIAYQLALAEHDGAITALVERAAPPDGPTRRLLKVSLANYFAAATMMPYEAFRDACEKTSHDIELIGARFGASFEQVCHRLTTLSRPTSRGIPFFMLRVDTAGNISKRFAGAAFPFSRFGGSCPRWRVHEAFRTPGRMVTQIVETPDGARYFTLARTANRVAGPYADEDAGLAIGLGCELKHAPRLVYSRGLDLADPAVTEIGPACRVCERPACPQRAAEPLGRTLMVDDFTKSISPYPFSTV